MTSTRVPTPPASTETGRSQAALGRTSFGASSSTTTEASILRGTSASSGNGSEPPPGTFFEEADRKYGLTRLRLCDLGCSYGMNLVHCHEDAYGVEFDNRESDCPRRLGLTVFERDFVRNDVFDLPKVETVWCGVERCSSTSNRPIGSCAKSTSFSSRADSWFCSCQRPRPSAVSLSTGFRGSEDTSSAIWRATTSMRSRCRRWRSRVSEPDSRLSRSRRHFRAPSASLTGFLRWRASSTAQPTSVAPSRIGGTPRRRRDKSLINDVGFNWRRSR